jgi:hypothetical protein
MLDPVKTQDYLKTYEWGGEWWAVGIYYCRTHRVYNLAWSSITANDPTPEEERQSREFMESIRGYTKVT